MDFILQALTTIGVMVLLLFLALIIWLLQDDPDNETQHPQQPPPNPAPTGHQTLESREDIIRQAARLKLEQDAAALAAARTMLEIARLYRQE